MNPGIGKQEWDEYKRRSNKANKRIEKRLGKVAAPKISPAKIRREKIERQAETYVSKMNAALERRDYVAASNYMSLLKLYTYKLQAAIMDEFLEGL